MKPRTSFSLLFFHPSCKCYCKNNIPPRYFPFYQVHGQIIGTGNNFNGGSDEISRIGNTFFDVLF